MTLSWLFSPPSSHRETNLKVRQALTVTGDLGDNVEKLADFSGTERFVLCQMFKSAYLLTSVVSSPR